MAGSFPALDDLMVEIADLRPLSAVAARTLEITENERFSAHELAQVIASDQALTAKMLRLANSAYYGFPRRINTVRDAVVLLGFRAVRSATLASCVIDAMPETNILDYEQFWHFSVTVGMLAEVLSQADRAHTDEAFTAGVVHNIGRLALDQHLPSALQISAALARQRELPLHDAQRLVLGYCDADLGAALTLHWNFPQALTDAVANHALRIDDQPDPRSLATLVARARAFARSAGLPDGLEHPPRGEPPREWTLPPVAPALHRSGGIDGVRERVDSFLETALGR